MYSRALRVVVSLVCAVGGLWALRNQSPAAWPLLAAALLLLSGYWRYGTVWLAWRAFTRGDLDAVERLIANIRRPERLDSQQRAYYEWLRGELARRTEESEKAVQHFEAAVHGQLRSDRDRAFGYSRLAEATLAVGKVSQARLAIASARALSPPPFVEALLRDIEESMEGMDFRVGKDG